MTRLKCTDCGGMDFKLISGRLSMTVLSICIECDNTVAKFSRMDFTE